MQQFDVTGSHNLRLTYEDGGVRDVDFQSVINKGRSFSALADPDFFRQVALSDDGRYIIWPGDLDFCADALRAGGRVTVTT